MLAEYLEQLRSDTTEEDFITIIKMTDDDIRYNRTNFNKNTSEEEFIRVCEISRGVLKKC